MHVGTRMVLHEKRVRRWLRANISDDFEKRIARFSKNIPYKGCFGGFSRKSGRETAVWEVFLEKKAVFLSFLAICSRAAALDGKIEGFVRAVYAAPFFWHCKALRIMINL